MGDAVAQPVFQAGQMLTIVSFLFMQSVWFGLASIALIPLQAWLIPLLQRQINLLNKDRIREVRALSAEIGETAAGLSDLRTNGGGRYRLAQVSNRLGHLFEIRRRIFMKKFFMKFLNNLIGHLTPFFFYAIGGVLAIRGEITVGALVAALAAYKDLSSPWKELLTYYNQVQDMSLRWQVMIEKFTPAEMIKPELFEGEPKDIPHLRGDIELRDVVVKDTEGNPVLDGLTMTLPAGARVAIQCTSDRERAAFAQLLTREILPSNGTVTIAGHALDELHQGVIAARIGYAYSDPYLFDGSVGDNVLMPLRNRPRGDMAQGLIGRLESVKAQIRLMRIGSLLNWLGSQMKTACGIGGSNWSKPWALTVSCSIAPCTRVCRKVTGGLKSRSWRCALRLKPSWLKRAFAMRFFALFQTATIQH
jgi:putative ABC transport system ATP-binding protein